MKKSIVKKINYLLAASLIALSICMISINLWGLYNNTIITSDIMLSKSCENQASKLNNQIALIEQSINNLYELSENIRPTLENLKDSTVADAFCKDLSRLAIPVAKNTIGATAIYYRINPDITLSGTTGFFYTKNIPNDTFEETTITNLYQYDVNDTEHVGWYYTPVWAGKAVWMDPYYNANLDLEMISYVTPIYEGPYLIGVLGMDIDFNVLKDIAEDIHVYESCGAVLCSMSNSQIYYNKCDLLGNHVPNDIYTLLQGQDSAEKPIKHSINDENYNFYFVTLKNHMKLLVYAKRSEVFAQTTSSLISSVIIFFIVFAATLLVALRMGRKLTTPIKKITQATVEYSNGNWDTKVSCQTDDELQLLAENISVMADKTKEYIQYIEAMAKTDGLTGLKNKAGYIHYIEMINKEYASLNKEYAVIVFDVNNLKVVNDNYGHEKGDELLLSASKTICKHFSHSPIFRIGGDEFVAIVDSGDYEKRDELIADFQKYMDLSKNSNDVMTVCIASGIAHSAEGSNFEEVFAIADQRMYENKIYLKGGVAPR